MAILPDIDRWNYENEHFFHKGRWVTQQMLDKEEIHKRTDAIFADPTLTQHEKLHRALHVIGNKYT